MQTEYEATFLNVDKNEIRQKLKNIGAELTKPEYLQKRYAFDLPWGSDNHSWARVRDEQDKVTMSYKRVSGNKIEDQKEINLTIDNFENGVEFLEQIGCKKKSYQENKRELWKLNNIEICIDEWPFIEPFVEVEGKSEKDVKEASEKLGFNYSEAVFGATDVIVNKKYGISLDEINRIPKIVFDMENPFLGDKE
jgi:adenylate cyclase class 2